MQDVESGGILNWYLLPLLAAGCRCKASCLVGFEFYCSPCSPPGGDDSQVCLGCLQMECARATPGKDAGGQDQPIQADAGINAWLLAYPIPTLAENMPKLAGNFAETWPWASANPSRKFHLAPATRRRTPEIDAWRGLAIRLRSIDASMSPRHIF